MHKEYVLLKLAAFTFDMRDKVLDKLWQVNKHHLSFVKDPEYTLSKVRLLDDEASKVFLQQNKHVRDTKDVIEWIAKNLNTRTLLATNINSKGENLGWVSDAKFALLKELNGANKLKAKKQLLGYEEELARQAQDTYKRFVNSSNERHREEAINEVAKAEAKSIVFNRESEPTKKRDRVLKKVLRKLWSE